MSKNIGKILKECRIAANITVKEISELLTQRGFKASESTVYSWENDNSQPTPGALLTMCTAYGIEDVLSTFGYNGYKEDGGLILNINEQDLIEKYRALDEHGKKMVDFTLQEEWARSTSINNNIITYKPLVNAAHVRTDVPVTGVDIQHDNNIMDDENF